jgi:hypothetical protein
MIGRRSFAWVAVALMGLVVGGCASTGSGDAGDKPGVVQTASAVYLISGGRATAYPAAGKIACPDCTKAVEAYAVTGKLDPNCPTCKAPRTVLMPAKNR